MIIPIVYYEGRGKWTADLHLKDRIDVLDGMEKYIPDFVYEVVSLNKYTNEELSRKQDEISLVMLMNKIQTPWDLERFRKVSEEAVNSIFGNAPDEIQKIYAKILWSLLMKIKVPNDEAEEIVEQVQGGRSMGYLFENMDEIDIQAERRKTEEQRRKTEEERRKTEEQRKRAEEERKKAEEQKMRAEIAEAEVRRLKAEIEKLKSGK